MLYYYSRFPQIMSDEIYMGYDLVLVVSVMKE